MSANKKQAEFTFFAKDAALVLLSGSFNDWSDGSDPMKKDKTGTWKKTKILRQDTYEYKFIVDDEWTSIPIAMILFPTNMGRIKMRLRYNDQLQPGFRTQIKKVYFYK